MHGNCTTSLSIIPHDAFVPVCHDPGGPGLMFLLDTLDATEEHWRELPEPARLFFEEARAALLAALSFAQGVD